MESKSVITGKELKTEHHLISPTSHFPNNPNLPLVIYRSAFPEGIQAEDILKIFETNNWTNSWVNGIYNFHHYHSTAHEVLAISAGCGKVQFGGPAGIITEIHAGDAVIIPAGVAHKNLGANHDFTVIGAYPQGQYYDMNYGESKERPYTDNNIKSVKLPDLDPIFGKQGELGKFWK